MDNRTGLELWLVTDFFQAETAVGRILCDCNVARHDNSFHPIDLAAGRRRRVAVCALCRVDPVCRPSKCGDLSSKQLSHSQGH